MWHHKYGGVGHVFQAMSGTEFFTVECLDWIKQTFGVVTMLTWCGFCTCMFLFAVFVVYVHDGWPCMMDCEIAYMTNLSTDHCRFSQWTFMPPLIELRAVHRLLIKQHSQ